MNNVFKVTLKTSAGFEVDLVATDLSLEEILLEHIKTLQALEGETIEDEAGPLRTAARARGILLLDTAWFDAKTVKGISTPLDPAEVLEFLDLEVPPELADALRDAFHQEEPQEEPEEDLEADPVSGYVEPPFDLFPKKDED